MSFLSRRILNQHELATGATQDLSEPLDLGPYQTLDLTVTGRSWIRITAFTRYLRWTTTGSFDTPAVVTVDLVARE